MTSSFFIGFAAPPEVEALQAKIARFARKRGASLLYEVPLHAVIVPPRVPTDQKVSTMIQVQGFVAAAARTLSPVSVFGRPLSVARDEHHSFLVMELEGFGTASVFAALRANFADLLEDQSVQKELSSQFVLLSTRQVSQEIFDAVCEEVRHGLDSAQERRQLTLDGLSLYERESEDHAYRTSYAFQLGAQQAA